MTHDPLRVGETQIISKGKFIFFVTEYRRQKLVATAFLIILTLELLIIIALALDIRVITSVPWWFSAFQISALGLLCYRLLVSPSKTATINIETGEIESRFQLDQVRHGSTNAVRVVHEKSLFTHKVHLQDPQYQNVLTIKSRSEAEVKQAIRFLKDALPPWEARKQSWPRRQLTLDRIFSKETNEA